MSAAETIVPATPELVTLYFGRTPPYSFRGWVAMRGDVPIGLAGIYDQGGMPVAFSEYREDMRPSKRTMVKGARLVEQMMNTMKRPVFAICGPLPTSNRMLAALGFEPVDEDCERGKIMVRAPA